jgi:hypothetical protein
LVLIFLPFFIFAMSCIATDFWIVRVSFTIVISVVCIPIGMHNYNNNMRNFFRKSIIKTRETDKPIFSEFEIDETGLACRRLGWETKFSWSIVQKIINKDDSIEVITKPISIAIIPKRIFDDPSELQEWIQYIENHIASKN